MIMPPVSPVGGPYRCGGARWIIVGEPEYCCRGTAGHPESPCGCMNLPINGERCDGCEDCQPLWYLIRNDGHVICSGRWPVEERRRLLRSWTWLYQHTAATVRLTSTPPTSAP